MTTPDQLANKENANDIWHDSSFRLILTNANYTGDLVQGKTTTRSVTRKVRIEKQSKDYIILKNTHKAIIPRQDFEMVQLLIASRKRKRPQEEKYLFTNTMFCEDCGKGMH
ncbi:recombinase family protein [Bacillus toyonensis]|uniref:recombinase family protein n=1 Tax=Bacillus toyonensis TaxID=155322 RepID=UPI000BF43D96|nr:hypothetical protein COL33_21930 [Bacillus toyonensis]PGC01174.1 hypothetical protein COM20_26790 [Bacillus toyonensis]